MTCNGQLFGPGIATSGESTGFTVDAFGLNFNKAHHGTSSVSWNQITWRRGGFNDSQVLLEWTTTTGAYSLAIASEPSQQTVLQYLLPTQQETRPPARGTRAWILGLVGVFVVLPILVIAALVWQSDHLIGWAVERIPVDMEKKLGEQAFAQFRLNRPPIDNHSALPMLREVGAKLTKGSVYTYQFHVVRDPTINAFAMPGGYVVFHTGLLEKADRAEEVAGVLAHEIQHVERRHSLRGMVHDAGLRVALTLLLGDTGGSAAASLAQNLGNLRFSRAQETDADLRGVKALVDANIDPRGMVDFFKKLAKDGVNVPAIISSHPASDERFESVEKAIPAGSSFPTLAYNLSMIRGK